MRGSRAGAGQVGFDPGSAVEMQPRLTGIAELLWQDFGVSRELVNLRCKSTAQDRFSSIGRERA